MTDPSFVAKLHAGRRYDRRSEIHDFCYVPTSRKK